MDRTKRHFVGLVTMVAAGAIGTGCATVNSQVPVRDRLVDTGENYSSPDLRKFQDQVGNPTANFYSPKKMAEREAAQRHSKGPQQVIHEPVFTKNTKEANVDPTPVAAAIPSATPPSAPAFSKVAKTGNPVCAEELQKLNADLAEGKTTVDIPIVVGGQCVTQQTAFQHTPLVQKASVGFETGSIVDGQEVFERVNAFSVVVVGKNITLIPGKNGNYVPPIPGGLTHVNVKK